MQAIYIADPAVGQVDQSVNPRLLFERQHQEDWLPRPERLPQQIHQPERMRGEGKGQAAKQVEAGLSQRHKPAGCSIAGVLDIQLDPFGRVVKRVVSRGRVGWRVEI